MIVESSMVCPLCSYPCRLHLPPTQFATSTNEFMSQINDRSGGLVSEVNSIPIEPGTGAERWLAEKMNDPEYAKAYQEALSRMDNEGGLILNGEGLPTISER